MMFSSPHNQMYSCNMSQPMQKWKPNVEIAPNCPRCDSPNTKFCYYNNYSLTQPRYFCKGCRRYWTKGGSLRNVPIGGGCRKNRRSKSSRIMSNSSVLVQRRSASEPITIRPDQALNDMVGGNYHHQTMSMVDDASPTTTIDLAVLYNKFLNPSQVISEHEVVLPAAATSVSCSDQNMESLGDQYLEGYLLDSGGFDEQLAIPTMLTVGSEGFFPNLEWEQGPDEQQQAGVDLMRHCQDLGHGDWCGSSFGGYPLNFGAFSM